MTEPNQTLQATPKFFASKRAGRCDNQNGFTKSAREWKVTIAKTFLRNFLHRKTFAAGAVSDGVGIRDFEAALL
jgi:hypothetical protein